MKRRTTTRQLSEALKNDLLQVTKAECYHKTSRQTNPIDIESFIEDLQFLCEANVFMDCVGWHYEKDFKTNQYILEAGRCDAYSENIVIAHLRAYEGVSDEDVRDALLIEED